MAKIAKRHATLNSLLNQKPQIDRLVNYAWYPGTVQLHKAPCACDAFPEVTFHLYKYRCVNLSIFGFTIREHGATVIILESLELLSVPAHLMTSDIP